MKKMVMALAIIGSICGLALCVHYYIREHGCPMCDSVEEY